MRNKYRVECGQDVDHADTLADAKYRAGVMILAVEASLRDAQVRVIRQLGKPQRWSAHLDAAGDVRLQTLFTDSLDVPAHEYEQQRAQALADLIDREERRRKRQQDEQQRKADAKRRRQRQQFGKGTARPVICISTAPPKWFPGVRDAARWVGVSHPSMVIALQPGRNGRRRTCSKMQFAFADTLPAQIVAAALAGMEKEKAAT